jgi:hypothetical protein
VARNKGALLLCVPFIATDIRLEMVVPAFAALLAHTAAERCGDH